MSTIEMTEQEFPAWVRGLQGKPVGTSRAIPVETPEVRRQYTDSQGRIILYQAQVNIIHHQAHAWNPETRQWERLQEVPPEHPAGVPLHPDQWGPGGYKTIEG